MSIRITFEDGARVGKQLEYDDSLERLVLGRDPQRCNVIFPADQTMVGREHCAFKRVLGRYRLVLNENHEVHLDGQPAVDDQELSDVSLVQLGGGGPKLRVETLGNMALPGTMKRTHDKPAGEGTMIRNLDATLRRTRILAVVFLVLLVGAFGVAWSMLRQSQKTVDDLTARHARTLGDLNERVETLKNKMKPRVEEALTKAAPSVYLILIRNAEGNEAGVGTAWMAGPGVLGTNAHVADAFTRLDATQKLLARSNAMPPRDYVITKVQIHPGYPEFQKLWTGYKPSRNTLGPSQEQLQQIAACDVALMWTETSEGLAPPLPIVDDVDALSAGDVVGFVGYPMEAMAVGGVNLRQPSATFQFGHVTAVTDFFLTKSPKGGLLVQHSLPVAGGASGSPILNADGKVVALVSAGNLTSNPNGIGRISTGVGVNFGQRVDLLQELLQDRATEIQAKRGEAWRDDIKQFVSLREKIVDILVGNWIEYFPGKHAVKCEEAKGTLDRELKPGEFMSSRELKIDAKGSYYIIAVAGSDQGINLHLFDGVGHNWSEENLLKADEDLSWYSVIAFDADAPRTVEAVVSGAEKAIPFSLYLYRVGD